MPLTLYPTPFSDQQFYALPLDWLLDIRHASDLDVRDLLLCHLLDGQIIFDDEAKESHWCAMDKTGRLQQLFSRPTYTRWRDELLAQKRLQQYERGRHPRTKAGLIRSELEQGIQYVVSEWPPRAESVYRPHGYIRNRWPVWLGNNQSGLAMRAILLALLAKMTRTFRGQAATPPLHITATWEEIELFIRDHLTAVHQPSALLYTEEKLQDALRDLCTLGVVEELSAPLRCSLRSDVFSRPPDWPPEEIASMCHLQKPEDGLWVALIRDLMLHCCEPVQRLRHVGGLVSHQRRKAQALATADDLLQLRSQLHQRRKAKSCLLQADQLVNDFIQQQSKRSVLIGTRFELACAHIAQAVSADNSTALHMPAATAHRLNATQLRIRPVRSADLSVAETQTLLADACFVIWQENGAGEPTMIHLPCPRPKTLGVDCGFVVPANHLHNRLDYSRPFELLLKCPQPEPRLTLQGDFRLLPAW